MMDDCISRQAAIDAIRTKYCPSDFMDDGVIDAFAEIIQDLPSAQPERKTGKWVWDENGMDWNLGAWVCSECHARNDNIPPAIKYNDGYRKVGNPYMWQGSKFCPNCGARMVQEGEDNDG